MKHLSLFTSHTEDLLSEDETLDTGAQQRTTLSSSKKRFFNPRTFGQGEDGKHWLILTLKELELYLMKLLWQACTRA